MFETMVARWVVIISVSHIPCYSILTYRPLLAHWASHVHYSLSFLIALLTFLHQDRGPLVYGCIVWESHESWAYGYIILSLFFLPLHYCIPSYLIGCVLHLFFFILSTTCSTSSFLHPKQWFSSIHYMEDGHITSIIYTMDIDPKTLSLRRSSHWREFMLLLALESMFIHYWSYHLWSLFCSCSGYVH